MIGCVKLTVVWTVALIVELTVELTVKLTVALTVAIVVVGLIVRLASVRFTVARLVRHLERSGPKGVVAHKWLTALLQRELAMRIVRSQRSGGSLLELGCIKHDRFMFHPFSR